MKKDSNENKALENAVAALAGRIDKRINMGPQHIGAIPGLSIYRFYEPTEPTGILYEPRICIVTQGEKTVLLGDESYIMDARHFLITSVDLPTFVHVSKASKEEPYLGLVLKLEQSEISQLMVNSKLPPPPPKKSSRGMAISEVVLQLITAFQRLLDLMDEPDDIPILAKIIKREIFYRLLVGEQGSRLRQMASEKSQSYQIARAIQWLKNNFNQPLRVNDLAEISRMSSSTFHHHFRSLTAMSPIQYQKWLRLHEARRLMLVERIDSADAAFQVGYESPSQFSREYKRLFGAPPKRDIKKMFQMMT